MSDRTLHAKFGTPDAKKHSVRFNEIPDSEGQVHVGAIYVKKDSLGPEWHRARSLSVTIEVTDV